MIRYHATATPAPDIACIGPNKKWATELGFIKTAGRVAMASGQPYFDPANTTTNSFTVTLPAGYTASKLTCYDCDHYGQDGTKGWKVSWTGGSLEAKSAESTWGVWYRTITGPNSIIFDGGGDSAGGNVCVTTP